MMFARILPFASQVPMYFFDLHFNGKMSGYAGECITAKTFILFSWNFVQRKANTTHNASSQSLCFLFSFSCQHFVRILSISPSPSLPCFFHALLWYTWPVECVVRRTLFAHEFAKITYNVKMVDRVDVAVEPFECECRVKTKRKINKKTPRVAWIEVRPFVPSLFIVVFVVTILLLFVHFEPSKDKYVVDVLCDLLDYLFTTNIRI